MKPYAKIVLISIVVSLCSFVAMPAFAGPFEEGETALEAKRYERALIYYKQAAEGGNFDAAFRMAQMAENGLGGQKNLPVVNQIYMALAQRGYAPAKQRIAAIKNAHPQWIVGHWGQASKDGKGGYSDGGGLFGYMCSNRSARGFVDFQYIDGDLVANIIGNSLNAVMHDMYDKSPTRYTVTDATHVSIYPKEWGEDWLDLEKVSPDILHATQHRGTVKDKTFYLKRCPK